MCQRKSRKFSLLLVLSLLLSPALSSSYSYADVILSDSEATELMNEIQKSKEELENVKSELSKSQKASEEQAIQLQDVKSTYEEQKKYYEMQLKEEKKRSTEAKIFAGSASASTILISVALLIVLL